MFDEQIRIKYLLNYNIIHKITSHQISLSVLVPKPVPHRVYEITEVFKIPGEVQDYFG